MFDSGQRLSLNFCQDAWLCHFLADGVRAGRGRMKGREKGSSRLVHALYKQDDDLAQLVFIANKHAKCKHPHPYAHVMSTKTHSHTNIYKHKISSSVPQQQLYKVRNKRCSWESQSQCQWSHFHKHNSNRKYLSVCVCACTHASTCSSLR